MRRIARGGVVVVERRHVLVVLDLAAAADGDHRAHRQHGASEVVSTSRLIAPIELPTKYAESTPSAAQNAAMCRIRIPRPSTKSSTLAESAVAEHVGCEHPVRSASAGMVCSQPISAPAPNSPPCSSTTGGARRRPPDSWWSTRPRRMCSAKRMFHAGQSGISGPTGRGRWWHAPAVRPVRAGGSGTVSARRRWSAARRRGGGRRCRPASAAWPDPVRRQ